MSAKANQTTMTDRERILINVACALARDLAYLQCLPVFRGYLEREGTLCHITAESGVLLDNTDYKKGDLVVCQSSATQETPWNIGIVMEPFGSGFSGGLVLRTIGGDRLCNWSNESFIRLTGIPERLLWEGVKKETESKIHKALAALWKEDCRAAYNHRFRGIEFDRENEGLAYLFIGESFGGIHKPTKPYRIDIVFTKRTTIKAICEQMKAQGYGTREFEPMDEAYDGPMQGLTTFTKESLTKALGAAGIELKEQP